MNIWHYNIVKEFYAYHYTDVIREEHVKDMKVFHKKQGWVVECNKEKYFFPLLINGKPLRECLPIKILKKTSFSHGTSVYYEPTTDGMQTFHIPEKQYFSFREWVDSFGNFTHTNPSHFQVYRLLILGSLLKRVNFRVCANPAFGKDSLPTILSFLYPFHVGIITPKTAAKLMTLLDNKRLLLVNEIPDVKPEYLEGLEPVIRASGDMRPMYHNNALSTTGTKDHYLIDHLSMGFLYNELQDYKPPTLKKDKTDRYFDFHFTKATCDRFLPLLFEGTLDVTQFEHGNIAWQQKFTEHHGFLKKWVMTGLYFMEHFPCIRSWKRSQKIVFRKGRMAQHYETLLCICEQYAESQEEFDRLCTVIHDAYLKYIDMVHKEDRSVQYGFTEVLRC